MHNILAPTKVASRIGLPAAGRGGSAAAFQVRGLKGSWVSARALEGSWETGWNWETHQAKVPPHGLGPRTDEEPTLRKLFPPAFLFSLHFYPSWFW